MRRILGLVGSLALNLLLLGSIDLSARAAQEPPAGEVTIAQLAPASAELLAQLEAPAGVRL